MVYVLMVGMVLASAIEALLWKKNQHGPLETMVGSALWGSVIASPILIGTIFFYDNIFVGWAWDLIGYTVLVNVFTMICVAAWVMVLRNMPISIANPISLVRLVFLMFFSWLIFGGGLSIWEILLVGGIFFFCAMLGYFQMRGGKNQSTLSCSCGPLGQCGPSCTPTERQVHNYKMGLLYMGVWLVSLVALEMFAKTVMSRDVIATTYVFIRFWLFFVACIPLIFILRRGRLKQTARAVASPYIIGIGILWAVASALFNTLLGMGMNVGIVSAINTAAVPLVILGGVLIFKERIRWYSYIFIILILASTVTLSLI